MPFHLLESVGVLSINQSDIPKLKTKMTFLNTGEIKLNKKFRITSSQSWQWEGQRHWVMRGVEPIPQTG